MSYESKEQLIPNSKLQTPNSRIIGIDPGKGTIGFGVIDLVKGRPRLVDGGVIQTSIGLDDAIRLIELYDELSALLVEFKPQQAAVETLFFAQNITTGISVAQSRGVILLCLAQAGVRIFEYSPLQIKMAMTGYGRATKSQIQEMVRVQLGLDNKPKPDDCADALAAAITHSTQRIV
jgi:crossover junction endodeoxyribonuclease RuvC